MIMIVTMIIIMMMRRRKRRIRHWGVRVFALRLDRDENPIENLAAEIRSDDELCAE